MPLALNQIFRSRWFAIAIHLGLWGLFYLALTQLSGKTPDFHIADASLAPTPGPVPVAKMEALFSLAQWPSPQTATNSPDPFFTTYFVPVQSPAPPPPTTRKIEVTYQGFYQAGDEDKHAVVKVADAFVVARVGAQIATNLFVAGASVQNLMLTNLAGQTNLLLLNAQKQIEIPIK